jgi:hypothetical protein
VLGLGAVADDLDLADGTSGVVMWEVKKVLGIAATMEIRTCRDMIILAIDMGSGVS